MVKAHALSNLVVARRGVINRSRVEVLALIDAAEGLTDEERRLQVLGECLYDDTAPWDLALLELCLVRCAEASRDRWFGILPALARRFGIAAPRLARFLEAEMETVDTIAALRTV
jgi:hypothetical protein